MEPTRLLQALLAEWPQNPSRADAMDLLATANAAGIETVDVVLVLAQFVQSRMPWAARQEGDGGGVVESLSFWKDGLTLKAATGAQFDFRYEHGYRWRGRYGWLTRGDIEQELRVWPGYLDAIEDLYRAVREHASQLDDRDRQRQSEHARMWEVAHESALRHVELGRHPQLRVWRARASGATGVAPEALKSIQHLKRLETSMPCHVYFLVFQGEVVYVGQTTEPWPARILTHLKENSKQFDDVWFLEVDRASLLAVESRFISQLSPRYNVAGVPGRPPRRTDSASVSPELGGETA